MPPGILRGAFARVRAFIGVQSPKTKPVPLMSSVLHERMVAVSAFSLQGIPELRRQLVHETSVRSEWNLVNRTFPKSWVELESVLHGVQKSEPIVKWDDLRTASLADASQSPSASLATVSSDSIAIKEE